MQLDASPESLDTPQAVHSFRWVVCALLFFATTINYMDRAVMSILEPTLREQFGWNNTEWGTITMFFQLTYAFGYTGFGWLIDRIGTRRGYTLSVLLWSLAAMAHAAARSVWGFGWARAALGLSEAGNFPAAVKAVAEWFPKNERALATGLFNSGSNVGALLAPLLVPPMTLLWGWQASFLILGGIGFLWIVLWYFVYRESVQGAPINAAATASGERNSAAAEKPRYAWSRLLKFRQTWAFVVGTGIASPFWWFYLFWIPPFLHDKHGLVLETLGTPIIIIYTMTCFGSLGGGWLSSLLLSRGLSVNLSRKMAMLVCALCVVPVFFAAITSNLWVAAGLIGLAAAAHQGWMANVFTMTSDMFPSRAVGSVVGLGGMFGALASAGASLFIGIIVDLTKSYWSVFSLAAVAYLIAFGIIQVLVPRMDPVSLEELEATS